MMQAASSLDMAVFFADRVRFYWRVVLRKYAVVLAWRHVTYSQIDWRLRTNPGKTSSPDKVLGESKISTACPWR